MWIRVYSQIHMPGYIMLQPNESETLADMSFWGTPLNYILIISQRKLHSLY